MKAWYASNNPNGFVTGKRFSIDKPCVTVMAQGMGGDWLGHWYIHMEQGNKGTREQHESISRKRRIFPHGMHGQTITNDHGNAMQDDTRNDSRQQTADSRQQTADRQTSIQCSINGRNQRDTVEWFQGCLDVQWLRRFMPWIPHGWIPRCVGE